MIKVIVKTPSLEKIFIFVITIIVVKNLSHYATLYKVSIESTFVAFSL